MRSPGRISSSGPGIDDVFSRAFDPDDTRAGEGAETDFADQFPSGLGILGNRREFEFGFAHQGGKRTVSSGCRAGGVCESVSCRAACAFE